MKLKDIQVGEDYAVGSERWNDRVTVLEVGVYGSVYDSTTYRSHQSAHPNFVRVQWHDGRHTNIDTEVPRRFLRPWSEQESINAERATKAAERKSEARRIRLLHDASEDMLAALEYIVGWNGTDWSGEKARDMARAAIRKAKGEEE